MQGTRVDSRFGNQSLLPGEYGLDIRGVWMACTPNGHLGDLSNHKVTVNADQTITVSPSILVTAFYDGKEKELWHGYLEQGVWRSV